MKRLATLGSFVMLMACDAAGEDEEGFGDSNAAEGGKQDGFDDCGVEERMATLGAETKAFPYIGGCVSSADEFPSTVQLNFGGFVPTRCTGVKVAPRIYMTAYHCNHFITPSPGTSVSIEWGPNVANAHLEGREQAVTVTRATAHPSAVHFFSEANRVREAMANEPSPPPVAERDAAWLAEAVKGSDIGLIAVEEDIDAVPAAVVSFDPLDLGDVVIMGGYGRESVDGPSFARLRFGIKQVAAFRGGTVELPEGDVDGGRSGVAPGDSGGPAYVQDEDGQFVVVGVNSIRDDTFRASSPDGIVPSLVAALSSGPHWPELSVETWFREFVGDDD